MEHSSIGEFKHPAFIIKSARQNINTETRALLSKELELIDMSKTLNLQRAKCMFITEHVALFKTCLLYVGTVQVKIGHKNKIISILYFDCMSRR